MSEDRTEIDQPAEPEGATAYERPAITSLGRFAELTRQSYNCV